MKTGPLALTLGDPAGVGPEIVVKAWRRLGAEGPAAGTNDTSADGHSTRGTTNDNDTQTRMGTDDTSANGDSTRGTTNDNDTRTRGGHTRTR